MSEYGIFPECDAQPPAGVGDAQLDDLDRELAEASEALWAERAEWRGKQ